jgi:hypothetical protein
VLLDGSGMMGSVGESCAWALENEETVLRSSTSERTVHDQRPDIKTGFSVGRISGRSLHYCA